jgi:hypothetical protein
MELDELALEALEDLYSRGIPERNDAVMFDIDDTLMRTNGEIIGPIVALAHRAKAIGYRIVIITARPHWLDNVEYTKQNLRDLEIKWDRLAFCHPNEKGQVKRDMGYNFVLSVGDQPWDLTDSLCWLNTSTMRYSCGN